jgi:undecaprenyl-diphosphatase
MTVAAVIGVAVLAAVVVGWWSRSRTPVDPIDPTGEERWLIGWLLRHPRVGGVARWLDHNVVGGLLLVVLLVVLFAAALVVGWLLDAVNAGSGPARWDRAVADWGSENATEDGTDVLEAITHLGGSLYLSILCVAVAGWDYLRRRRWAATGFLAAVMVGIVVVNNGLKLLVDRERPDVEHLVGAAGSSFPSGHSAAAAAGWAAIALIVSRSWPRRWRAVAAAGAALVAAAVAASRALLGVHWFTDIVAGLVVGWAWFTICAVAFGGRVMRLGAPAEEVAEELDDDRSVRSVRSA